jgi:hypothetical protein
MEETVMKSLTVAKIFLGLLFMACASNANTLFLYQISYAATSGPIQSFSTSFASQNLLTGSSGAFAFDPFTITDGTNTWVMEQGIATLGDEGGQCLNFGTLASLFFDCSVHLVSDQEGGFLVFFRGSLPTQPGTFTPDDVFGAFPIGPHTREMFFVPANGSFNFEITQVPVAEPMNLHLFVIGLALTGWRSRRMLFHFATQASRQVSAAQPLGCFSAELLSYVSTSVGQFSRVLPIIFVHRLYPKKRL